MGSNSGIMLFKVKLLFGLTVEVSALRDNLFLFFGGGDGVLVPSVLLELELELERVLLLDGRFRFPIVRGSLVALLM